MSFCIPKHLTNLFKEKLKSGEITPEKLADMDSAQRHGYFASFLGDANATKVNELFESKLLLKSQQQGIINWAKQVTGMKPEVMRDIVSRVNKMDKILNPKDEQSFLEDIVAHKLGVAVTMKEAANISALAKDVAEKKAAIAKGGDRLEYGRAKVAFDDYVNGLKHEATTKKLSEYIKPQNYVEGISNVAGLAKSMKASLDNSVIGRQGLKVLLTHPDVWLKNSAESFVDMARTFGGHEVMNEVRADVMSRPNAINGLYKKEGLAVGVKEEAYPIHISEKIPVLGKLFKASETAFTAFQYRTRADVFDQYVKIAEAAGGDTQGLGLLANSLTGRGKLGALEPVANKINTLMFSPRFLKSNIDTLTAHSLDYKNMGETAKKQAAINTLKIIAGIAGVLAIAKAVNPDSVELDPRSADFGKIKIGDTRFDASGGIAPILTLAARLATQSSKSSVTGNVNQLNSGKFGSQTGVDVALNFLMNKASPAAGIVIDMLKGKDRQGKDLTLGGEINNLMTPLPISNYLELKNDPNSANILAAMIADELGISTNTYGYNADWTESEGKELKQFHNKMGDEKFKEANTDFNNKFNQKITELKSNPTFKDLSEDDKAREITAQKAIIKNQIFKDYGFHYQKEHVKKLPKI